MIAGNTRIYEVSMVDKSEGKRYSLTATVRDMYDTLKESNDEVELYLKSNGGFTKADTFVKIKNITRESHKGRIYRVISILGGLNEKITANDSALYCTEDTRLNIDGVITEVPALAISKDYEVTQLDSPDIDVYDISLDHFSNGGNIIRTNIDVNGLSVML